MTGQPINFPSEVRCQGFIVNLTTGYQAEAVTSRKMKMYQEALRSSRKLLWISSNNASVLNPRLTLGLSCNERFVCGIASIVIIVYIHQTSLP